MARAMRLAVKVGRESFLFPERSPGSRSPGLRGHLRGPGSTRLNSCGQDLVPPP
ncbi:hypothetical protein [Melittangium boletus]|uniref:hypothetical protein n=1 Tax=Melittangium boletus TaxID=83453 RepID=UPI003DA5D1D9